MQPIQTIVKQTYFDRFSEMTLEYRLHFASRLYSWEGDESARHLLHGLMPEILPPTHDARREALLAIKEELVHKDYERDVNNYARRKPFFEAYPDLLLVHNVLFRIRHWFCIYGVDERSLLYEIVPKESVHDLLGNLRADQAAQVALSTYFVNTSYLYAKLYPDSGLPAVDPSYMLDLGSTYDKEQAGDIQLLIYLYTHCILGETLFYYQPIPISLAETYRKMLQQLDELINDSYDDITLDNKFEFLVCAQICDYTASTEPRIREEANLSLNQEGFIVDTHNHAINPAKQTFLMSEHRNVLFVMGQSKPVFEQDPII